jgi:hypothetical protein
MRVLLMTVAMAISATSYANASDITWSKPISETGKASDVITSGTIVGAVTAGRNTTVNGVKFVGRTPSKVTGQILFGPAPIKVDGAQNAFGQYGGAPATWDPGYRLLVAGGSYSEVPTSPIKVQISGLTIGHKYLLQIFEAFWNANFATSFVSGQNPSSALNLTGDARTGSSASSVPQFVTGTFVADSESTSISLNSTTGYVIFDAIQVRDMGAASAGK